MFKRLSLLTFLALGGLPGAALACACCADPGTRFQDDVELGAWEVGEIARLAPTGPARLYQSACGLECVGGIKAPQTTYDVVIEVTENGMSFTLDAGAGRGGMLVFPWPDSYTWFAADPDLSGQGDTRLYTEMRFRGAVAATGDFAQNGPLEAELVLSGFGNMCITTRSFSGWMLSVSDEAAQYRLFGQVSGY